MERIARVANTSVAQLNRTYFHEQPAFDLVRLVFLIAMLVSQECMQVSVPYVHMFVLTPRFRVFVFVGRHSIRHVRWLRQGAIRL